LVVAGVLLIGYFIRRKKISSNVSSHDPATERESENVDRRANDHVDHLQNSKSRRFTYKELEKLTNNFKAFIGHGGFGPVYYGRLENGTEVAVKMRSESS
ncbi:hypothetical protein BAE44_0023198, partial [Dichanthelium oligosanthes]